MKAFRIPPRLIPLLIILPLIIAAALIFFLRAPVLLVTDTSFDLLYGPARIRAKQIEVSVRLWRPVWPVPVSETVSPDLAAIAVQAASAKPYAVFFPYRYEAGARYYNALNPEVKTAVFMGRKRYESMPQGIYGIYTDSISDVYKAGQISAQYIRSGAEFALFYDDYSFGREARDVFSSGLRHSGGSGIPIFLDLSDIYPNWQSAACVILTGNAADYLDRNRANPAVLFSWLDPDMTPQTVNAVFDDSPWALLHRAVKEIERGSFSIDLASDIILLEKRVGDRTLLENLRRVIRSPLPDQLEINRH